jgi:hypothetical protein
MDVKLLMEMIEEVMDEAFSKGADIKQAKDHLASKGRTRAVDWLEQNFNTIAKILMDPPFALGSGGDDKYVKIRIPSHKKEDKEAILLHLKDEGVVGLKVGVGSVGGRSRGYQLEKELEAFFSAFRDSEVTAKNFFDFVERAKPNQKGPDISIGFLSPDGEYDGYVDIEVKLRLGSNAEFIQIATAPKSLNRYDPDSPQKIIYNIARHLRWRDPKTNKRRKFLSPYAPAGTWPVRSPEVIEQLKIKNAGIDLFYIEDKFYTPEVVFSNASKFRYVTRKASSKKGPRLNVCLYEIDTSQGMGVEDIGQFFE